MKKPFPRVCIDTAHTAPKKAERLQVEFLSAKNQVWRNKEKIKEKKANMADDGTTTSCRCVIPTVPTTRKKAEHQVEILAEQKRKQMVEQRQIISRITKNVNNKEVWHNKEKIKEKSKENVKVETTAEITDQSVITTISQKADRLATDEDERTGHGQRITDVFITLWLGTVDMMDSNALINDIRDEWLYFKETCYLQSVG
mmetsp:Transcript_15701/g.28473  ORF Transcript_15701/g.28473 Transcript_15701/m.28473 type:complete len:200 (-) Transcript_15701:282-881(-)|eukprot:CAMPEP_0201919644 /NCGR_PEP_ID=MMETSP0903-20130614/8472_1 /ASSEMBLY_ACC=CAM_ASM_000552 /TAXON_ID=420261 /ORGANISM="Thalassiosira antarctica, Strain CCMP982" /LENGTH=199 /DNA_ID=CAMNT_0048456209 /DNA_START=172 /DNA_END=771 /DNA_ORIENTATION=-